MNSETNIKTKRFSMHKRIWQVMVSVQLAGLLTVTGICSYEAFEALSISLRGQLKTIILNMGEALEQPSELPDIHEKIDRICGGHKGYLFYWIWQADNNSLIMTNEKHSDILPQSKRAKISKKSLTDNRNSLWIKGPKDLVYFARWRLHEGKYGKIIITTAVDATEQIDEFVDILVLVAGSCIAVMAICAALTHWFVGILTRPLIDISTKLRDAPLHSISTLDLHRESTPKELSPFIDVIQNVIRKLDDHRRTEKRLVADVSHDLRTPVALMKSSIELTLSRPDDPQSMRDSLKALLGDTDRISVIINQLIELARLDETLLLSDCENIESSELAEYVTYECRDLCSDDRAIQWNMTETPFVYGNPGMLRRLLVNLARNALQYGPPEGEVYVNFNRIGPYTAISVIDQGGNLKPKEIAIMTKRFTRLDDSRNRQTGGCGLGLSIVGEIVRLHNGKLEINSTPETGTEIKIIIPNTQVPAK